MKTIEKKIEVLLAHLFCFFFIAQVLSPSINEIAIYIDVIIAALNPFFLIWCIKKPITKRNIYIVLLLCLMSITGHFMTGIKLAVIFFEVSFLFYLYEKKLFFINTYIVISICFAVIQFSFLIIDPSIALLLGPENIAESIWGSYAIATNANFYSLVEGGIPHVSGLSREAGFMASLLLVDILLRLQTSKEDVSWRLSSKVLYLVGYIVTFTKISVLVIPLYLVRMLRRQIDKLPALGIFFCWMITMVTIWTWNADFLSEQGNITFLHRFGAYAGLLDLDIVQTLFGTDRLQSIDNHTVYLVSLQYDMLAGFGGWLVKNGVICAAIYVLILYRLGITSTGLLILLIITINVQVDTNQNFVVLAYYFVLKFYRKDSKRNEKNSTVCTGQ